MTETATVTEPETKPETAELTLTLDVESALAALGAVAGVVPTRSPKAILQNLLLECDPGAGSQFLATDLDVAVRHRVVGVRCDRPCRLVLPPDRLKTILSLARSGNTELTLGVNGGGDRLRITGHGTRHDLPLEDPALFPAVPDFDADAYEEVAAGDLLRLLKRTMFATDVESTRFALGGCLLEVLDGRCRMVGTDGRRMAVQEVGSTPSGGGCPRGHNPVLPMKAMKLLERLCADDDPPVRIALAFNDKDLTTPEGRPSAALFRTERATVYTRLVEGRYPRYEDVFDMTRGADKTAIVEAGTLLLAVQQAAVATSDESRGVDCAFEAGRVTMKAATADRGDSEVVCGLEYSGDPVTVTLDHRYATDALRALDPGQQVTVSVTSPKLPVLLTTGDGWRLAIMPITRSD